MNSSIARIQHNKTGGLKHAGPSILLTCGRLQNTIQYMFGHVSIRRREKLNSALAVAIFWGNTPKVENLLRKGADPNAILNGRSRSLDLAIQRGNLPLIEALLAAGADPLEPFVFAGAEFRLSDYARRISRSSEIVERLHRAEQEAIATRGPPRPLRSSPASCALRFRR
jgi:hypothetical protein